MEKKTRHYHWMLRLMCAFFLVAGLAACGSSESSDDEKKGGGIAPDPDVPTISEANYVLNPKATMISETVQKQLTGVDTLGHKFILPLTATKPEVGQTLIFSTITKELPEGLLAKVKSVAETSSGYQVIYEEAELKDAFKDIDIPEQYIPLGDYVEHVYDANGKEVQFERVATTRASGSKNFKLVLPEISIPVMNGVVLTPKLTLDMYLRFMFQFGDYELSYAGVKIDTEATFGADLTATLKEGTLYEKRWRLYQMECAPIPVYGIILRPAIGIDAVVKVDGKLSLEASVSYKRTMHAIASYQKGAGMTGDFNIDPEAPDAFKFTFGPKFEGGFSFGPSVLVWLGIYTRCMCLRGTLDLLAQNTISGKIDLAEFTSGTDNLLTPFKLDDNNIPEVTQPFLESLMDANKWNFLKMESLSYNLNFAAASEVSLIVLGKTVSKGNLPGVSIPVYSSNIFPQVEVNEKDFFNVQGSDVTLMLHHKKKSLFDKLAEFRAEFKPVGDNASGSTIVKTFDFNDEKIGQLWSEVTDANGKTVENDVTTTAKASLNSEESYDINVYMKVLGIDFTIFSAKGKPKEDAKLTVTPDRVTFDFKGGSNSEVKMAKGNYKYCGVEVPAASGDWLVATTNSEGAVTITAKPNLSFDARSGEILCWVSNKSNPSASEKQTASVTVHQDAVTGVDWNPKSLSFSADGGSEKISFEFGGFKRYGAQVRQEGQGWCGVAASGGKLTITVQTNPSKESRECIVDAYVTDAQNATDEDKLFLPITVFQAGGDGQAAANNLKELWGTWTFTFNASGYYQVNTATFGKDGSYHFECVDHNKPENSFTRVGTYKVLSHEVWNPTDEGVVGLAEIEESFHNSLTGKDVVRTMTVRLYNNGYLGYQNYRYTKVE